MYMCKCWLYKPAYRPTFVAIVKDLSNYLNQRFYDQSFYYSDRNQQEMLRLNQHAQDEGVYDETPLTYTPISTSGRMPTHSQSYPMQEYPEHSSHQDGSSLSLSNTNCDNEALSSAQSASMPVLKDNYILQNNGAHISEEHAMLDLDSVNNPQCDHRINNSDMSCCNSPHSNTTPHQSELGPRDPWSRQTPEQTITS